MSKNIPRIPFSDTYHVMWNKVSGQVAKLTRLDHSQAPKLRERMGEILPLYDSKAIASIWREADRMLRRPLSSHKKIAVIQSYRRLINKLGIMTRTNRPLAKSLRRQLKARFSGVPSKVMMWE